MESGIYKISCTKSKRIYIGSSKNISTRIQTHFYELKRGTHHSPVLQNTFNKYGKETFSFEILENTNNLLEREQHYLDTLLYAQEYLTGVHRKFEEVAFNILPTAGSTLGIKRISVTGKAKIKTYIKSDEHRKAISEAMKERIRLFGSNNLGRVRTQELKNKISNTMKEKYEAGMKNNFLGRTHSKESKQANREKHLGKIPHNSKPVIIYHIDTKEVEEFLTTTKVIEKYKNIGCIHNIIDNRRIFNNCVYFYKEDYYKIINIEELIPTLRLLYYRIAKHEKLVSKTT